MEMVDFPTVFAVVTAVGIVAVCFSNLALLGHISAFTAFTKMNQELFFNTFDLSFLNDLSQHSKVSEIILFPKGKRFLIGVGFIIITVIPLHFFYSPFDPNINDLLKISFAGLTSFAMILVLNYLKFLSSYKDTIVFIIRVNDHYRTF